MRLEDRYRQTLQERAATEGAVHCQDRWGRMVGPLGRRVGVSRCLWAHEDTLRQRMARVPGRKQWERALAQRTQPVTRVRIQMRPYQQEVFEDRESGIMILHWARQIGKSFTLAAWAVDRLLTRPGRLVTVLSNSRDNGAEFVAKCAEVCQLNGTEYTSVDASRGIRFQNMRMEVRIRAQGQTGRIKVLAANPRTARGFSGDLILDEFAFHEDSAKIWEAAEPILSANKDYLCRIASTGNGRHNLFYRMVQGRDGAPRRPIKKAGGGQSRLTSAATIKNEKSSFIGVTAKGFKVSRITRTQAHQLGVMIYDANTREPIEPETARAQALDKRAYDQNYECAFANENLTLLTHELISAAEREDVGFICEQEWGNPVVRPLTALEGAPSPQPSPPLGAREEESVSEQGAAFHPSPPLGEGVPLAGADEGEREESNVMEFLRRAVGPLYVGFDVARKGDLSVITVLEDLNGLRVVRAILRMRDLRLPEQQQRLEEICRLRKFHRAAIDMTGLGLGLFEYAQSQYGSSRIHGINFGSTVPATGALRVEGRRQETVRVTEAMAMELLQAYEDRRIQHPADPELREDLRKPERVTTAGGRVSIAATRDEAGHADHFWSLALALEAAGNGRHSSGYASGEHCGITVFKRPERKLWL